MWLAPWSSGAVWFVPPRLYDPSPLRAHSFGQYTITFVQVSFWLLDRTRIVRIYSTLPSSPRQTKSIQHLGTPSYGTGLFCPNNGSIVVNSSNYARTFCLFYKSFIERGRVTLLIFGLAPTSLAFVHVPSDCYMRDTLQLQWVVLNTPPAQQP